MLGIDFTSAPSRRKPITLARGGLEGSVVHLLEVEELPTFADFEAALAQQGPWIAACDFPFGLPRELVLELGWPTDWPGLIRHYGALSRAEIRATFAAFCAARRAGAKFAHRACDGPAGSSPSMKWVNPPVALMLHAGAPRLLRAGVDIPGLRRGDPRRVVLEAYPGLLAREVLGRRSYKSDDRRRAGGDRRAARGELLEALAAGRGRLGLSLDLTPAQRTALQDDFSADRLDAVLCLMQAAWASSRAGYGLPETIDAVEGWIVSAC